MIVGIILAFLVAAVAILIMAVAYLFEITDSLESSVNICSRAVRKQQDYIGIIFDRIIAIEKRELEAAKCRYHKEGGFLDDKACGTDGDDNGAGK